MYTFKTSINSDTRGTRYRRRHVGQWRTWGSPLPTLVIFFIFLTGTYETSHTAVSMATRPMPFCFLCEMRDAQPRHHRWPWVSVCFLLLILLFVIHLSFRGIRHIFHDVIYFRPKQRLGWTDGCRTKHWRSTVFCVFFSIPFIIRVRVVRVFALLFSLPLY